MEEKKTHRLVEKPQMSVRFLADYMAASDQARRTILRGCKYRATARMVQHEDAKLAISKYILGGTNDPYILETDADYIRNKMADDDFDRDCNDVNADYVGHFSKVAENIEIPKGASWEVGKSYTTQDINGVRVTLMPNLNLRRPGKNNVSKIGVMMLRYKKGMKLPDETAAFQSAIIHGMLCLNGASSSDEVVDTKLCLTVDCHTGIAHSAPTTSVSRFNNAKAACATIAEVWDNVKAPPNAVL